MPYEKRILDMIKSGGASAEKRIYKFAKKRVRIVLLIHIEALFTCPSSRKLHILTFLYFPQLGTHRRRVQKREEIKAYNAALRAKQAAQN